jgi:hypothetical protein
MTSSRDSERSRAAPAMRRAWPRWLRRGPLESIAIVLILAGVAMLLQPFSLEAYGYSFLTTLAGVATFTIVSKFPE